MLSVIVREDQNQPGQPSEDILMYYAGHGIWDGTFGILARHRESELFDWLYPFYWFQNLSSIAGSSEGQLWLAIQCRHKVRIRLSPHSVKPGWKLINSPRSGEPYSPPASAFLDMNTTFLGMSAARTSKLCVLLSAVQIFWFRFIENW